MGRHGGVHCADLSRSVQALSHCFAGLLQPAASREGEAFRGRGVPAGWWMSGACKMQLCCCFFFLSLCTQTHRLLSAACRWASLLFFCFHIRQMRKWKFSTHLIACFSIFEGVPGRRHIIDGSVAPGTGWTGVTPVMADGSFRGFSVIGSSGKALHAAQLAIKLSGLVGWNKLILVADFFPVFRLWFPFFSLWKLVMVW